MALKIFPLMGTRKRNWRRWWISSGSGRILEKAAGRLRGTKGGRVSLDAVLKFKMLVLQNCHWLSQNCVVASSVAKSPQILEDPHQCQSLALRTSRVLRQNPSSSNCQGPIFGRGYVLCS